MQKSLSYLISTAILSSSIFVANPALARKASSMTDLNGSRAAGAESEIESRGFKYVSGNKGGYGSSYSYWWHKADNNCIVVEVMEGKVMTINDAKDKDCGHSGGGNAAAAVGVVAGAALLGALLSHKSHHTEGKSYDEQNSQEFDRGYKDGLYSASYHNYSKTDAYSHGYQVGVDERNANLSHHHNKGGYAQVAQFKDLQGARAAGGMDELGRRGFTQVDNFVSGTARYSIQWRAQSRQCLQVITADGHFEDIRDIGSHPKCR